MDTPSPQPTPQPRLTICPYCGSRSRSLAACESCGGRFDALSRQATQNAMGPWFVRIESQPFRPGCSYETLLHLIDRGTVRPDTAIRGPTTKQFWMLARWCPGVAHRLGICHSCQARVDPASSSCAGCGAVFVVATDRQQLGLGKIRALPGQSVASVEVERPAEGIGAAEPPSQVADSGQDPAVGIATKGGPSVETQRIHRLHRELKRSRRWTRIWSALVVAAVLGGGGYLLYGRLDLGAGPAGHWRSASDAAEGQDAVSVQPQGAESGELWLDGAQPDVRPENSSGLREETDDGPIGADDATGRVPVTDEPDGGNRLEEEIAADPRLSILSGLRRLR